MDDNRKFTRVDVELPVLMAGSDGAIRKATTVNVSWNGLYVRTGEPLAKGHFCRFDILVDRAESGRKIRGSGSVVRSEVDGMGVEVFQMDDMSRALLQDLLTSAPASSEKIIKEILGSIRRLDPKASRPTT